MGGSIPSFALKFPVTGVQSSDFFGMFDFEGFSGFNFFKESFRSSLPLMTKPWLHHTVGAKLAQLTPYIGHMSHAFHKKRFQEDGVKKIGLNRQKNVFDLRYEPVAETVSHFTDEIHWPHSRQIDCHSARKSRFQCLCKGIPNSSRAENR